MNFIDTILQHLEDNDLGDVGTDLFSGELPLDENECVSLVLSPSPPPNQKIPYFGQGVDAWVRYSKFEDGYDKLQAIFDLFHGKENYEVGDYHIYVSYAQTMIQDMDRDLQRRHLFMLPLFFSYRKKV